MKRRSLFLALAAGLIVSSLGALEARAGYVPLPTTIDQLTPSGAFTYNPSNTNLVFSNFQYSASSGVPLPSAVIVNPFNVGSETGITFNGSFNGNPGTSDDIAISYVVTLSGGGKITDAYLSGDPVVISGTGSASVVETLYNNANGNALGTMIISDSTTNVATLSFAGVTSILVHKDINVDGITGTAKISFVNQGYSIGSTVPEPASLALLGIGMTGFLAFRRFFKKTSVA